MKYITIEEAAKNMGLSARSIRNYCAQKRIPGAKLVGKTWYIPEDVTKPERSNSRADELDNEAISLAKEMIEFIDNSPVSYVAVKNAKEELLKHGYKEVFEGQTYDFHKGDKIFIIRNDSCLLALNIGNNIVNNESGFHLIASHADSPSFKIKPECNGKTDNYNKINLAPYGGMIASTWLDRVLAIAGRVIIRTEEGLVTRIVNLKNLNCIIPNLCIHFNREVNTGYAFDMNVDMQAYLSQGENKSFKEILAKQLKVDEEDIVNFDLFTYNAEEGKLWGDKKEYISSPRLDDLECVFTSLKAFLEVTNNQAINVLYIADNEEVGSLSRQGADGDFALSQLKRVAKALKLSFGVTIANSFMISADNAHAVHPNKPNITDANNKAYMNEGIVIKFNSLQTYTSDGLSSAIMQELCRHANVKYQFFANRSDLRGGSTLGNHFLSQVSLMSVDIGLAQLAMHSSYETCGTKDVLYAYKVFKEFYQSKVILNKNTTKVLKVE